MAVRVRPWEEVLEAEWEKEGVSEGLEGTGVTEASPLATQFCSSS